MSGVPITGAAILDQVAASGIEFIVSVPDITTSAGLLWPDRGGQTLSPHPRVQRG